jgi:hypothetical protein
MEGRWWRRQEEGVALDRAAAILRPQAVRPRPRPLRMTPAGAVCGAYPHRLSWLVGHFRRRQNLVDSRLVVIVQAHEL